MANKDLKKLLHLSALSAIKNYAEFKDYYDAKPNSRFDICACSDGSIKIAPQGQCGKFDVIWMISTSARWK